MPSLSSKKISHGMIMTLRSRALRNPVITIQFKLLKFLGTTTRPADFCGHTAPFQCSAKPDEDALVLGRQVARTPDDPAYDSPRARENRDFGPDGVAVAPGTFQFKANPLTILSKVVSQQYRPLVQPREHEIGVAVIIHIPDRETARNVPLPKAGPAWSCIFRKARSLRCAAEVVVPGTSHRRGALDDPVNVSVDKNKVLVAITVVVEEFRSPSDKGLGHGGQVRFHRPVLIRKRFGADE